MSYGQLRNKFKPYFSKQLNVEFITENFTKAQLEKKARRHGIELDKRKSMKNLIEECYDVLT
jgi:hypothetical protein